MTCHPDMRALHPQGLCLICPEVQPRGVSAFPDASAILAAGKAAQVIQAERRLSHFVRQAWHVLEPNTDLEWSWHIESIADHVQYMIEQWLGRREHTVETLVINVPPGSMKSLILNVFAPAWAWLPCNAPHWNLLSISGSDSIVIRDADKTRDLIKSVWYVENFLRQPDGSTAWEIRSDKDSTKSFKNTLGGWRKSQTQAARVTGDRFDAIFLDDPNDIKDISDVKLNHVERTWYAAGNRLNDMRVATRIVIQQRTHERDLTGVIMANSVRKAGTLAKKTEHLCIPMEYTEVRCACGVQDCDTTIGKHDPRTEIGQVLHPERNTPEVIAAEKIRLGSLGTAGQLNQRPAPEGGAMFKLEHWRHYDELPRDQPGNAQFERGVLSVDCTFGAGKPGEKKRDRVAMLLIFPQGRATRFIEFAFAKRMGIKDTIKTILDIYARYTDPYRGHPMIGKILIEAKANGEAVIELLQDKIPGVCAFQPKGDNISRANACLPTVEAGNIRIKRNAPWDEDFTAEMAMFPHGAHDDYVDAFTQAITEMTTGQGADRLAAQCVL